MVRAGKTMTNVPEADALLQQAWDARRRARFTESGNLEAQARQVLRQAGIGIHDMAVYMMEFKEQAGRRELGLRAATQKLAQENPGGIRRHLLPILRESGEKTARRPDPNRMTPEDAMQMVDDLREQAGFDIRDAIQDAYSRIREQKEHIADVEKAWKKWDWRALQSLGLISQEDQGFVKKVQGLYSW